MWRRWSRRLALVAVSIGAALVAAELAVARWFPVGSSLYELDEVLLFRPIPGARSVLVMSAREGRRYVPLALDAEGFRGPGKSARRPRIALYGDSFVMAENVRFADTFGERLEVHLAELLGRSVEVVQAGASGYGPDQAFLRMQREIETLAPDLVLFVLCAANDFGDLVRNKMFRLAEDGELVANDYTIDPSVVSEFAARERAARRPALVRLFEAWRRPSPARRTTAYVELYLRAAAGHYEQFALRGENNVYTLFQDFYDADLAIYPDWPSSAFKRDLMGALLERIAEFARGRGVPLFAVVVPPAVDLDETFDIRVDTRLYPSYDAERLGRTLAELLDAAEIPFLDLYSAFRDAGPRGLFEGGDDAHWNVRGQDFGAQRAARALADWGGLAD